jgi:hypothetical protein
MELRAEEANRVATLVKSTVVDSDAFVSRRKRMRLITPKHAARPASPGESCHAGERGQAA